MAAGLQIAGLVLGILSWCFQSSCTSSKTWRVTSHVESVTTSQSQFEGLWMSCAANSLGSIQCTWFKTVLGLPGYLQACRALMILSLLLGLASIVTSILGLKCTNIGRTAEEVKERIVLIGGTLFILSGILTLTAVSWYAAMVIQDFYEPLYGGRRFELGTGLYLGWAASGLAVLGGSMLCSSCRRRCSAPRGEFSYYSAAREGKTFYRAPSSNSSSKAYV